MSRRIAVWATLVVAASSVLALGTDARSAPKDPAARGLDLFVHMPDDAPSGGTLPLQLMVLGFPAATTTTPLGGARIDAMWDPESLGPGISSAPKPIHAASDASGRAQLLIAVPKGAKRKLRLILAARSGEHQRTHKLSVARMRAHDVSLFVADRQVVPGTSVSLWVLVKKSASQVPAAGMPVDVTLLEGGVVRRRIKLRSDAAGVATGRISIPPIDLPTWTWTLSAEVSRESGASSDPSRETLKPRDETPGKPRMWVDWKKSSVAPGKKAQFSIRFRDASERPVANHAFRYWIGPKGTNPPEKDKKWRKVSKPARTNLAGRFTRSVDTPATVSSSAGTELRVVARTTLEGRDVEANGSVHVGHPSPTIELLPEAKAVVAGLEQRMLVRVQDGRSRPISSRFLIKGDGLQTTIETNADGEAELRWRAPAGLGARRDSGPCAYGVSASVTLTAQEDVAALGNRRQPFEMCVPVEREQPAILQLDPPLVRAGKSVNVRLIGAKSKPWSVIMRSRKGGVFSTGWIKDGEKGSSFRIPASATGLWTVTAVSPGDEKHKHVARGALLVAPTVLPRLTAKVAGGRAVPGGRVQVDARLTDEHGKGLRGTVAAVVYDRYGGGSTGALWSLDARRRLCTQVGIGKKRCDRFLEGDTTMDPVRRGQLGQRFGSALLPKNDPGADSKKAMIESFESVIRSLEQAVLQSTESPDRLRDAGRKAAAGRWVFNPEVWTLVTSSMDKKPVTPGGKPLSLADVVALDPQVTFDNVARRVTRLKLLRVLTKVNEHIRNVYANPDEPALRDPAALLRRLVRNGVVSQSQVLDPWGGTMQFVRAQGASLPFLTVRGFRLQAPGPDGRLGTHDDVRGPFDRVLRSGTPYAEASGEDRVVDARLDMMVAASTIAEWGSLLESLTGTGEAFGMGGIGTIGHGAGTGGGAGFGRGGGVLRRPTGKGFWIPPQRTGPDGRIRLSVPLGDTETTYRIVLIGVPDRAQPAVAMTDVPVSLSLSARVEPGVRWTEGDIGDVVVTVRNGTKRSVRASVQWKAGGSVALVDSKTTQRTITISPRGATPIKLRVRALKLGDAQFEVKTSAPGLRTDTVQQQWKVQPAAEPTRFTQMAWVDGEKEVRLPLDRKGSRPRGAPRLIIERGQSPMLEAALRSVDPDSLRNPEAMADALDVAARIYRWAVARGGDKDPLARKARDVARRALGRLSIFDDAHNEPAAWKKVVGQIHPPGVEVFIPDPSAKKCPPEGTPILSTALSYLEAEPAPVGGGVKPCWDSFATEAVEVITRSRSPEALGRGVLALLERPHRAGLGLALVDRLREQVKLQSTGYIKLGTKSGPDRAARAVVYAALLRAIANGHRVGATRERLLGWLAVQRDGTGGYGSTVATRSVVRALLTLEPAAGKNAHVVVEENGKEKALVLDPSGRRILNLAPQTESVTVTTKGAPVLVRMERRRWRLWKRLPAQVQSPVRLDIKWPSARGGTTARLRVSLKHELGRSTTIDLKIPLPPGVELATGVKDVRQIQGALMIRKEMDESTLPTVMEIPLRFGLSGRFTIPEAYARLAFEEAQRAIVPARPLVIR